MATIINFSEKSRKTNDKYKIIDKFNFDTSNHIIQGIISGVICLHSLDIAHRDLKPDNILLQKSDNKFGFTCKVADFNFSRQIEKSTNHTKSGTMYYKAPEQFPGMNMNSGKEPDIWAIGAMIYELTFCQHPVALVEKFKAYLRNKMDANEIKIQDGIMPRIKTVETEGMSGLISILRLCCKIDRTRRIPLLNIKHDYSCLHNFKAELDIHFQKEYGKEEYGKKLGINASSWKLMLEKSDTEKTSSTWLKLSQEISLRYYLGFTKIGIFYDLFFIENPNQIKHLEKGIVYQILRLLLYLTGLTNLYKLCVCVFMLISHSLKIFWELILNLVETVNATLLNIQKKIGSDTSTFDDFTEVSKAPTSARSSSINVVNGAPETKIRNQSSETNPEQSKKFNESKSSMSVDAI